MVKIIQKIKNFFTSKVVYKSKCSTKEETKPEQEKPCQEKPEEQK